MWSCWAVWCTPSGCLAWSLSCASQGLALLALIPIWLYHGRQGYHSKSFQYVCYGFYPVHMLVIVLILNVMTR